MNKKYFVWKTINYGIDTRGNNIVLRPFEPLKIIEQPNDIYSVVKKFGRGQVRKYMVRTALLEPMG